MNRIQHTTDSKRTGGVQDDWGGRRWCWPQRWGHAVGAGGRGGRGGLPFRTCRVWVAGLWSTWRRKSWRQVDTWSSVQARVLDQKGRFSDTCVQAGGGWKYVSGWDNEQMKTRKVRENTKSCPTLAISWTVTCQAPLCVGFSRQEYWSGLPFPSPRELPDPGIEQRSPSLQADYLPTELHRKPLSEDRRGRKMIRSSNI